RRTHDCQQHAVAHGGIGGKAISEEERALGGSAPHQRAGNGGLQRLWHGRRRYLYSSPRAASFSRILYRSSPSSPEARRLRFSSSFATRCLPASATLTASARLTETTPSSSATITSPGSMRWPAQITGTFTEPRLALIVPCAQMHLLHTGNLISVRVATSRTPASMISP